MTTVIDASFAVELILNATFKSEGDANLDAAAGGMIAPVIFWHEVASAMRTQLLRKKITPGVREIGLRRLRGLDIALDAPTALLEPVITLSDRFQLTVYDAAYLELAMRTGSSIATRDGGLAGAARKAGVELLVA